MITITNVPLSVYNRALEIYGQAPEADVEAASEALLSAESRIDLRQPPMLNGQQISVLMAALVEYIDVQGNGFMTKRS